MRGEGGMWFLVVIPMDVDSRGVERKAMYVIVCSESARAIVAATDKDVQRRKKTRK